MISLSERIQSQLETHVIKTASQLKEVAERLDRELKMEAFLEDNKDQNKDQDQ